MHGQAGRKVGKTCCHGPHGIISECFSTVLLRFKKTFQRPGDIRLPTQGGQGGCTCDGVDRNNFIGTRSGVPVP